ncbi:MAG: hypothetical protein JW729_03470, partial [Bacteroidales bacterium]|nr:hypothetical protein [Bacteroidales bacterium]
MKALNLNHFMILISLLFAFSSCNKSITPIDVVDTESSIENLTASADFNWKTTSTTHFSIQTLDNAGLPVANVKVFISTDFEAEGGKVILSGTTNTNGLFQMDYNIATAITSLVVGTDYQGFPFEVKLPVENNSVQFTMGGIPPQTSTEKSSEPYKSTLATKIPFNTLGSWLPDGTPRYLERDRDYISSTFLADINTALPENQPVPEYHPEYLLQNYDQNIHLVENADVWVTFV